MTQLRIRISLVARFGTMVETTVASPYVSALLRFAPHLVGNGFIRSLQVCDEKFSIALL